ncbi:dTDP-4-dehydrorhamnose reductase [Halalkalibacter wakoensis JCM 9140]|uniref:dTDP-4-dehydrorhamnose reductase n=1 Tax=Halalkalibacter wakoensis JCM 9140 TaxID=1236970 RepID=W4Q2Q9_9BACI|nr:dTDP-4-dehydrorhamnose reductase [Halalkalibacter wakoensis]GAE26272.1 dTDP-4-dehydrorhamnose reductase [Halalkalibacter wakoensis JCM 9140]
MKILITGASGQLGQDVTLLAKAQGHNVYAFGKNELDVTSFEQVNKEISTISPDVIIHCAAYTKVDLAETEVEKAYQVNANGSRNIAVCAEKVGAKVCYISTDYVFDGTSSTPYQEYDQTNPVSIYGKSKLAGEELTRTLSSKYFIVRTSWVFGSNGPNFVKTMLRLRKEREEVSVVNDQFGAPTYTKDLASFLLELVSSEKYGVYHASNSGHCTWHEFAEAIFKEAELPVTVKPISTEQFPTAAIRPKVSLLDDVMIRSNGFQPLRNWREALREFLIER